MSWLEKLGLVARENPPAAMAEPVAPAAVAPAPDPQPPVPSAAQKRSAADHAARFERALAECERAIEHGEADEAELRKLTGWRDYYAGLAALEAGKPKGGGPD